MTDDALPDRRALSEGGAEAFAELYDRNARWMLAAARAITASIPDAEDAVHETFLELHRYRTALAAARNPRAYLRSVVRRAAVRVREHRRDGVLEDEPAARECIELDDELERALAKLPEEQREVLTMKLEGELTFEELGSALGISANTAASRYRYALEELRAELGGTR